MKRIASALAVAVILGAAVDPVAATGAPAATQVAVPAPPGEQSGVPDAAQPAVAVVDRFAAALSAGDLKTVGELLDAEVLILETGGAENNRDEYLGHHAKSDAAFLKGSHTEIKRRTARVVGDLTWVGTESELHAIDEGKPLALLSTETMILKKTGADWRIVHIHWSSRPKTAK